METIKKGKIKLAIAIVLLLLAVVVFFYELDVADINLAAICSALIYAELPFAFGIICLIDAIPDIKDGKIVRQWKQRKINQNYCCPVKTDEYAK